MPQKERIAVPTSSTAARNSVVFIANYCLNRRDRALIACAEGLLRRLVATSFVKPAELVSIAKVLHMLSRLPKPLAVTDETLISISVIGPHHHFDEIETYHWWDVKVEGEELSISSGGHFYRPSTGGDTFSTMSWQAVPGELPDFEDYREHLAIVPDVQSFPDAVAGIDFADGGYKVEVNDLENSLLDEMDDSDDEEVEDEEDSSEDSETNEPVPWSIKARDEAEEKLAAIVKASEVDENEPQYAYGIESCDGCGSSLLARGLFVDGRLQNQLGWANMCVQCFTERGAGVGWGMGQLYARQTNGDWRLVAGFDDSVPS